MFSLGIGVSIGIYYYERDGEEYKNKTIWMGTFILVLSAVLLVSIGLPLSNWISNIAFGSIEYRYLVVLALITTGIAIVYQPSMLYLQYEERAKLFVIMSIGLTLVYGTLSILFVALLKRGVQGLMEAGILFQLTAFLTYFFILIWSSKPSWDLTLAKNLIRVGAPYFVGNLSFFFIQYVDRYMLELYSGLEIVGIYSVGYNIGMAIMIFVFAFSFAWTPYFNSFYQRQSEVRELFGRVLTYYVMGMGLLCLCMFLFAKPLVHLMSTPAYYKSYIVVGIVAFSQLIYGCYLIFLPGLYYAKKTGQVNFILFISCLINIALNAIFIPKWDMLGAALATVVSFVGMAAMTHFSAKRYLVVQYDWSKVLRYLIILGLAATTSFVYVGIDIIGQIIKASVVLGLFVYLNYSLLNENDRSYLKQIWHNIPALKKMT
jgi:O-antigen/teichoic acid export membrane protein